ncbi:MAG: hypothetical protein NZP72_13425 [Geminicoccaceae bacterium]|nr:hypothetical protein [Geminicoccaceae bacterium]
MSEARRPHAAPTELARAIERILHERLGRYGLERIEVRGDEDRAGEPALFADVWYRLSPEPVDPAATAAAQVSSRDRPLGSGEPRFPRLRHHFAAGRKIASARRRRLSPVS